MKQHCSATEEPEWLLVRPAAEPGALPLDKAKAHKGLTQFTTTHSYTTIYTYISARNAEYRQTSIAIRGPLRVHTSSRTGASVRER